MSTAEAFWMSVGASGRLVELSRDECLELLGAMSVGRIAYTTDDGPRVLPVNYVLEGDGVIFRTVPDGEVFRDALETTCAFEIDQIDEFYQSGWSVLAVGGLQPADRGGVRPPPVRQDPGAVGGRPAQHIRPAAVRAADRPPGDPRWSLIRPCRWTGRPGCW